MPISPAQVERMFKQVMRMTLTPKNDVIFKRELYLLLCAANGVEYNDDITAEMRSYLNIKS